MSVLLRVAYDGTRYRGFARQGVGAGATAPVRTVQGELDRVLGAMYRPKGAKGAKRQVGPSSEQPLLTRGASRTDAGVHALGQLVAFDPPFSIPCRGLLFGLASRLPTDIVAVAAWEEEGEGGAPVQPRFGNQGKHYQYRIRLSRQRDPWTHPREWHLSGAKDSALDLAAMRDAAGLLVGQHDFASFRASGCQATTTVRRLTAIDITQRPAPRRWPADPGTLHDPGDSVIEIDVHGEAFLQNMVRIIAGTLVDVGRGRFEASRMTELLERPDRTRAGRTAPACGLTLVEVRWPHRPIAVRDQAEA